MPAEKRSLAVGLLGTGIDAGVVSSSQLTSWVRSSMGDDDWRFVYVVLVVIAAVVLGAALLFIGHEQGEPQGQGGLGRFGALRRMRGWIPLTSAYTSFGFMCLLVLVFLATKLEDDNGWTGSRASLAFTLVGVAMAFGGPLFIAIASRLGLTAAFTGWASIVIVILPGWIPVTFPAAFTGWASIVILPGWIPVTFPAAFTVGLLFAGIPSMITLYVVRNTTVEDYGAAFAAATLAFGVAQIIGPQIGGVLADLAGSFTLVFLLSAALAVTGAIASLSLPRRGAEAI